MIDCVRDCLRRLNLILVIPHGRSGSMLMQSLFDGHEQVIAFPYYFKTCSWKADDGGTAHDLAERFCGQTSLFGGDALQMGTNRDAHESIDVGRFKVLLRRFLDALDRVDDRALFICAHLALSELLGRDLRRVKYILLHVHFYHQIDTRALLGYFPLLRFVAMHRDPREEWLSYIRAYHWEYGEQDLLDKLLEFVEMRLVDWYAPFQAFYRACPAGHVKLVDLNRLHALQETAMRQLADWLQIEWSPTLTRSTFLGRPWAGNSFLGTPIYGFSTEKSRHTWKERLGSRDRQVLEYFLSPILAALRYETPATRPSRRETVRRLFFSKPGIFVPRRGSRYLVEREHITKRFRAGMASAVQGEPTDWIFRVICRMPEDRALKVFVWKHRVGLARVGLRELRKRYSWRRFTRLEAVAERCNHAMFADSDFV